MPNPIKLVLMSCEIIYYAYVSAEGKEQKNQIFTLVTLVEISNGLMMSQQIGANTTGSGLKKALFSFFNF